MCAFRLPRAVARLPVIHPALGELEAIAGARETVERMPDHLEDLAVVFREPLGHRPVGQHLEAISFGDEAQVVDMVLASAELGSGDQTFEIPTDGIVATIFVSGCVLEDSILGEQADDTFDIGHVELPNIVGDGGLHSECVAVAKMIVHRNFPLIVCGGLSTSFANIFNIFNIFDNIGQLNPVVTRRQRRCTE
jgi:hypothetical protein